MRWEDRQEFHSTKTVTFPVETSSKSRNPVKEIGRIIDDRGVGAKGRTGGGKDLSSTASGAPKEPRLFNFSTPSVQKLQNLTKEQKQEVDEHNRLFDETHERHGDVVSPDGVDEKVEDGTMAKMEKD